MIIRTLIVSTAMACLAMPAMASPGPLRQATDPAVTVITVAPVSIGARKDDDKSRVVCKRFTTAGTRTPGKVVCRTAGQWASEEAAAKEGLDDLTRRALAVPPRS
jgi:hypothetical protein